MSALQRRAFLLHAAWAASAGSAPRRAWSRSPALGRNPFALGVASGEPAPDGLVLWTRLLLAEPGQQQTPYSVRWELAHDSRFARIVQRGQAPALPQLGHGVHVQLHGLAPERWYHYRFMLGDAVSATGRTRTAPAPGMLPAALRLAFASCQRWEHGHYAAWRHLAADQPDLVSRHRSSVGLRWPSKRIAALHRLPIRSVLASAAPCAALRWLRAAYDI
ncbi:alkaline phosphatase D family protein [Verminephrobacter eiseniae]|uniref:alkaline phosphatase D family protein n=1 Tax=Verminephrobacter eiseniae TaxID=364317 RepID=UPI0005A5373E